MDNVNLTSEEAYKAMYLFLEEYYEVGGKSEEEILNLISGMPLLQDGTSADSAHTKTWNECVAKVLSYRNNKETGDEPWIFYLNK